MKNICTLIVASAFLGFTIQVGAAEPNLSPRAKANQIVKAERSTGSQSDAVRADNSLGVAAKNKASARHATVAGSAQQADHARMEPPRIGSPKGLQQLRDRGAKFEIAPMK